MDSENPQITPPLNGEDSPEDIKARIDFARSIVPKRKKRLFGPFRTIMALAAIVGIGLVVYSSLPAAKPKPAAKPAAQSSQANTASSKSAPKTQAYSSTNFNLSFNYPVGWAVVDNGSGFLTVTSPPLKLISDTGQTVNGQVTMTIQKQGQLPAAFTAGTDLAVLNSQLIKYSAPTSAQSAQTYISFVQYSSTNVKGGLDGIYITGNSGYQKDQTIPASDISPINPLVTVTFTKCGNAACTTNLSPLTISSSSWTNGQSLQSPILTLFTSLAFH